MPIVVKSKDGNIIGEFNIFGKDITFLGKPCIMGYLSHREGVDTQLQLGEYDSEKDRDKDFDRLLKALIQRNEYYVNLGENQ